MFGGGSEEVALTVWFIANNSHAWGQLPQAEAALSSRLHREGAVRSKRYDGDLVMVEAELTPAAAAELGRYIRPGRGG